jgi:hypothetical protein
MTNRRGAADNGMNPLFAGLLSMLISIASCGGNSRPAPALRAYDFSCQQGLQSGNWPEDQYVPAPAWPPS